MIEVKEIMVVMKKHREWHRGKGLLSVDPTNKIVKIDVDDTTIELEADAVAKTLKKAGIREG